jgi:hypothetical protein
MGNKYVNRIFRTCIIFGFILIIYVIGFFKINTWTTNLYGGDSHGYYLHVVSAFRYHDIGDYSRSIASLQKRQPGYIDPRTDPYGIRLTEKGKYYIKYTVGVGVLETPFFFIAHIISLLSDQYEPDGWSKPYLLAVGLGAILYILIGLYFLLCVLRRYFDQNIAGLTILSIALATNLFYQGTYVTMAHGFLFFLYCMLIFSVVRFYDKPTNMRAIAIGSIIGLITITRIPEIISAVIPLFWGVYNRTTVRNRLLFLKHNIAKFLICCVAFLSVLSIQIAYWYYVSGELFFDPYKGEGFNFLKPHILDGLFNFSNGWLIYTPIMALSIVGCLWLKKYCPDIRLPLVIFVCLQAYIHYSYYAWTFFPGFGSRPMVETYPLLAFGLAALFQRSVGIRMTRLLPFATLVFFGSLNLFQTWQQSQGITYSERHNRAFYLASFGKTTPTINSLKAYDSGQLQPDTTQLVKVDRLYFNGFEDTTHVHTTTQEYYSGSRALYDLSVNQFASDVTLAGVKAHDWIEVGVHAKIDLNNSPNSREESAHLIVELYDKNNLQKKWTQIPIAAQIGNENYNIWSAGRAGIWGKASFFIKLPGSVYPNGRARISLYNPHAQHIYLDDLYVDHYRCK